MVIFFFMQALCYLAIFDFSKFYPKSQGERLFFRIFEIEEELYSGQIPGIYNLYNYKFFSSLLRQLLEYARTYGLPPNLFIGDLRKNLNKDLKFEREVKRLLWEGITQFVLIFLISWFFKYFASKALSTSFKFSIFAFMLQILGPLVFFLLFTYLKRQIFNPFRPYFAAYYNLWALMKVGGPTGEILGKSRILNLNPSKEPLKTFHQKIKSPLKAWEQKGIPIDPLIELLIEELWEAYDQEFQRFHKILKVLSFLILAFFYLGAYFMLVWGTLGPFLIEMKG